MDAAALHRDAIVVDTHNDLILLVDHSTDEASGTTSASPGRQSYGPTASTRSIANLPGRAVPVRSGLRRTLMLVERIYELANQHPDDVAVCITAADIEAATVLGSGATAVRYLGMVRGPSG
jgi:membrane dipeptidase